ncbi:MAG: hypothetical protein M1503_06195 [Thaumarchaeota archaeon]|nr:hypothetical protein [Nitrososphaerota archaeon]MCL5317834.1 hypothetical protein [Nitrososphaerota archaeon]
MSEDAIQQPQREPQKEGQRFWRVIMLIIVLTASFVVVMTFLANVNTPLLGGNPVPVRRDSVFVARPLQDFKGGFEGYIYADTNCVPVDNNTKLNCIAIISRDNTTQEKYLYSHPVEVPCLNRDELVKVEGTRADLRIIRLVKPTMQHG